MSAPGRPEESSNSMIRFRKALFIALPLAGMLLAQEAKPQADAANASEADKAGAYYHFAMARLYAGLAANEGNKHDYVSKAVEQYKEALKADPSSSIILEELTDIYIQTGQLQNAIQQAEELLKKNPDNLEARRMLGRVYVRALGNSTSRIDADTLKQAIEQYKLITTKDPKDAESWVMLGRLYRFSQDSPNAEKAFDAALKADPDNEDAQTQLAMLYAELGDSKRAIEKLQSAKNPNERTLSALADQYEQLKDYKNAAEALKKAHELAPDDGKIARELAQDLMYSDQLDDALKLIQELAADEPRDPQLPIMMSQAYRAKHDFAKAHEALNKAKTLDPGSMEVRYQEVKLLEAEHKLDEAVTGLKSLLDDTARRTYSENSAERRAGLVEEYGVLLRRQEKYKEAVDAFRQMNALGAEASQEASVQIIETYREAKDFDSALKEADAAIKKYPTDRRIVIEHANALSDVGKIDAGVDEIRKLGGTDEGKTQVTIAQLYEKGKRWADMGKALDAAEKAAKTQDDQETIHFLRGAMLERQKKFDLSESEFRKVLELNPENASALNYLGYMLADRNVRLDEAHQMIQKALELDPDNGAYLDSMGWVLFRQSKLDEAQQMLQRAVDLMGKDPTIHDHLGDVYLKMGKTREAISQWQTSLSAYQSTPSSEADPEDVAKVSRKLDDARVKLAQETKLNKNRD